MALRERHAARLAWTFFALTVALAIVTVVFGVLNDGTVLRGEDSVQTATGDISFGIMVIAFAALGALVASRRPDNPIGWILCASPLFLIYTGVARGWYVHTFYAEPGSLPVAELLVWAANWAHIPGFMPLLTLLLLLFPDGRPPSPRWRFVGYLAVVAMGSLVLGYAFSPGPLEDYPRVDNPLGIGGPVSGALDVFLAVGFPLFGLAAVGSMASMVVRFRRAHGEERQQLRWMAAAATLVVFVWWITALFDQGLGTDITAILPLTFLGLPAASAVAILRYRLYDLGLVIRRTVVYGALTVALAGSYLGLVLLLQLMLSPDSDFAIAGSTLAVAALFRPARRGIQAIVDRRFNRRRYDAAHTVEAFSARLRDVVELDALSSELSAVVRETMQPAHVSIWVRPEVSR